MITEIYTIKPLAHVYHFQLFVGHFIFLDTKFLKLISLSIVFLGEKSVLVLQLIKLVRQHRYFIVKFLNFRRSLASLIRMSNQILFLFGYQSFSTLLFLLQIVYVSFNFLNRFIPISDLFAQSTTVFLVLHSLFLFLQVHAFFFDNFELFLGILDFLYFSLNKQHVFSFLALPRLLTLLLVFELYWIILLKQYVNGHVKVPQRRRKVFVSLAEFLKDLLHARGVQIFSLKFGNHLLTQVKCINPLFGKLSEKFSVFKIRSEWIITHIANLVIMNRPIVDLACTVIRRHIQVRLVFEQTVTN